MGELMFDEELLDFIGRLRLYFVLSVLIRVDLLLVVVVLVCIVFILVIG